MILSWFEFSTRSSKHTATSPSSRTTMCPTHFTNYTVGHEKRATLFWTINPMFLGYSRGSLERGHQTVGYVFWTLGNKAAQHYYTVQFSPSSSFHWPQNIWPWMTLEGLDGRPTVSAARIFTMDSSFWRYKIYAGIHGGTVFQVFENFRQTYVYLS